MQLALWACLHVQPTRWVSCSRVTLPFPCSKGLAADPQAELVFSPRLTKAQRASVHGWVLWLVCRGWGRRLREALHMLSNKLYIKMAAMPQASATHALPLLRRTTTAVARDSLGTASRGMGEARAVVVLAKERAQRVSSVAACRACSETGRPLPSCPPPPLRANATPRICAACGRSGTALMPTSPCLCLSNPHLLTPNPTNATPCICAACA